MTTLAEFLAELVGSIVEMGPRFADVALADPLSALLVVVGAVLVGVASAVLGVLAIGAVVDFLVPEFSREPPQQVE